MKIHSCIQRKMVLGLFVLLAIGMGQAQIGGYVIKVEIPFQFSVGAKTFSAGEYSLKPLLPGTVLLRDQAGQVLTSIGTNSIESGQAPSTVKLVFNGYAGIAAYLPSQKISVVIENTDGPNATVASISTDIFKQLAGYLSPDNAV